MEDVAGWGVRIWEHGVPAQVDTSELLQQLRSAAISDPCGPVNDEIRPAPARSWSTTGRRATRGSRSTLRTLIRLGGDTTTNSSPSSPTPNATDLRAAVDVDRDQLGKRVGVEQRAVTTIQDPLTLAVRSTCHRGAN